MCALREAGTGRDRDFSKVPIFSSTRVLRPHLTRPGNLRCVKPVTVTPGERQMRFMMLSLLIGCVAVTLVGDADAAPWTSAKFPGEQDRAVQGCADDVQDPGDWFCIFVRCDQPRSPLSLHFSAPARDIHGDIKLVIDENTFAVSVPASLSSPLPLSTRAETIPDALIDAMKAGSMILIQGSHLQSPYNRISLENSRKAIERIERACARPYSSAASFWRRITRSLGFF